VAKAAQRELAPTAEGQASSITPVASSALAQLARGVAVKVSSLTADVRGAMEAVWFGQLVLSRCEYLQVLKMELSCACKDKGLLVGTEEHRETFT
jgi:hypothetical protein